MEICLLCGHRGTMRFLARVNFIHQSNHNLLECLTCGVIFIQPLPSKNQLEDFYSASYFNFDHSKEEGRGRAFAWHLSRWKKTGRLLDVGCANGSFISGVRNYSNWQVYGVEFGESAVRFARDQLKLDVRQGDLTRAGFPGAYFDYLRVNNVLEHVPNPYGLLRECRRIIKPDGIFYLSVPNGFNDSLDLIRFYLIEKKPARSKNGHIFFFPSRTLLMMFEKAGFRIIKKRTYNIKRGLRHIGWLPRKPDWRKDYFPSEETQEKAQSQVLMPDSRNNWSSLYYKYRLFQNNLMMIPGLRKFGLDFLFILKPQHGILIASETGFDFTIAPGMA